MTSGYPNSAPTFFTSETFSHSPSEPGEIGTPASFAALLAAALSPIIEMTRADGPTNLIPTRSHISANRAFSARNPYPGWMASALVNSAAEMIAGIFK